MANRTASGQYIGLVHRKQLQEQWIKTLSTFLDVPANMIGRIGGGRKK